MNNRIIQSILLSTLLGIVSNTYSMDSFSSKQYDENEIIINNNDDEIFQNILEENYDLININEECTNKIDNMGNRHKAYRELMLITNNIFDEIIRVFDFNVSRPAFNKKYIDLIQVNKELIELYDGYNIKLDSCGIGELLDAVKQCNKDKFLISINQFSKYMTAQVALLKEITLSTLVKYSGQQGTNRNILQKTLSQYSWKSDDEIYSKLLDIIHNNGFVQSLIKIMKLKNSKDITKTNKENIDKFIYTVLYNRDKNIISFIREIQTILNKLVQFSKRIYDFNTDTSICNKDILSNDEKKQVTEMTMAFNFPFYYIRVINEFDYVYYSNSSLQSDFNLLHKQVIREFMSKDTILNSSSIGYMELMNAFIKCKILINKYSKYKVEDFEKQYGTPDYLLKLKAEKSADRNELVSLLSTLKQVIDNMIQESSISLDFVNTNLTSQSSNSYLTYNNTIARQCIIDYLAIVNSFSDYLDKNSVARQKLYQFYLEH